MPKNIKVAIAGVGNCASALVQGVEYYRSRRNAALDGVMHQVIGGYRASDVEFVSAFDVDKRKVGRPLEEAIFAKPNNTRVFQSSLPVSNVVVQMGPELDGVAPHMADYDDDVAFRPADLEPTNIAEALRRSGAEVLLCYLPVGSEKAVKHYAEACLAAGVAMVNCVPVFLASDPEWAKKFQDAGLPIVGDDIKSQVGATIVHRSLARLFADRGVALDRTYQLNTAGNTDFLNMLERKRLKSKKLSKTESSSRSSTSGSTTRISTSALPTTFPGSMTTRLLSSVWRDRLRRRAAGDRAPAVGAGFLEQRRRCRRCPALRQAGIGPRNRRAARSAVGLLYEDPAAPVP